MTDYQRKMLPVLLYHRVVKPGDSIGKHKIWVKEKKLDAQLAWLKRNGYHTLTFKQLAQNPTNLPDKSIILTFDDGYEDNYTTLFPLLKKYGFTAVVYMVTGTDHNAWGVKEGEPHLPLMSYSMIKEMAEYGVEFGGHTHTHIDLSRASYKDLTYQIKQNYSILENLLGYPPLSFAYPFGGINNAAKAEVENTGYLYAVATNTGATDYTQDPYQIRRLEIRAQNGLIRFIYKASGMYFSTHYAKFIGLYLVGKI